MYRGYRLVGMASLGGYRVVFYRVGICGLLATLVFAMSLRIRMVGVGSFSSQTILALASAFGFPATTSYCNQKTTINNPNDPTSFISAQFCNMDFVFRLTVQNPPSPLSQVPESIASLTSLEIARFHNAFYGPKAFDPLLSSFQNAKFFKALNVTGSPDPKISKDPSRVLSGSIPAIPPVLAASTYFTRMGLSNNNFSGMLPGNYGDALLQL
ncbi:hypothetical protein BDR26DRAFT_60659 [Obelidium mucronatum]|nr:hypothetical protein BDR26DRAFT_60659 [Obelidium mucronatum]